MLRLEIKSEHSRNGAGDAARTRNIHLGKVVLYQLSYARKTGLKELGQPEPSSMTIFLKLFQFENQFSSGFSRNRHQLGLFADRCHIIAQ